MIKRLTSSQKKNIRKAVERELERYRIYKHTGIIEKVEPSVIFNADQLKAISVFCKDVEHAIKCLSDNESFLINERYIRADSDYITDSEIYRCTFDPPISEPVYSKIRDKAMIKLALILDIDTGVERLSDYI